MTDSAKHLKGAIQDEIDKVSVLKSMFSAYSEDSREFGQCELGGIALILEGVLAGLCEVLGRTDLVGDTREPDPEVTKYLDHLKSENERLWKLVETKGLADKAAA